MRKRELHILWHQPLHFLSDRFWSIQVIGFDFGWSEGDWHIDFRLLGFGAGIYWAVSN